MHIWYMHMHKSINILVVEGSSWRRYKTVNPVESKKNDTNNERVRQVETISCPHQGSGFCAASFIPELHLMYIL